jgi:hypothetical protein
MSWPGPAPSGAPRRDRHPVHRDRSAARPVRGACIHAGRGNVRRRPAGRVSLAPRISDAYRCAFVGVGVIRSPPPTTMWTGTLIWRSPSAANPLPSAGAIANTALMRGSWKDASERRSRRHNVTIRSEMTAEPHLHQAWREHHQTCGRICFRGRKVNLGLAFAGQQVGCGR